MTAWSAEEARRFLDGIAEDRLFAMWVMLITTGMRRGEVAGLAWDDLDFERGVLSVRRAVISARNGTHVAEPKTRRTRRSVPLDPLTLDALRAPRRAQLAERPAAPRLHLSVAFLRATGASQHFGDASAPFVIWKSRLRCHGSGPSRT